MVEHSAPTQRGVPAPPAITRASKPATAAAMPAAIAPPFLRRGARPAPPPDTPPAARGYELTQDEADRIAQRLEQLAHQVRARQLGLNSVQGPEDVAGILIAAITDHIGRGR
jgi:hypothetical protein